MLKIKTIKTTKSLLGRLGGFLILYLISLSVNAQNETYHSTPALSGDGIFSMLRRYNLLEDKCHLDKFLDLNNISLQSKLNENKYYYLPILIYKYNNKSIRSTMGITDFDLALEIQKYNEKMLEKDNRKQDFRNDKVLWVPYAIVMCNESIQSNKIKTAEQSSKEEENLATKTGEAGVFPIFGKTYEKTPQIDSSLYGQVYYIVGGHGGPDPGAQGKRGNATLCEDEYSYDVALRLCRHLIQRGAIAYMIVRDPDDGIRDDKILSCDSDELVWGDEVIFHNQKSRLNQRSSVINKLYDKHQKQGITAQRMIVIHVDSRSERSQTDMFFYYKENSKTSMEFAKTIHKYIQSKYRKHRHNGKYSGTVSQRDLHMLREVKATGVYIELGNIKNSFDQQRVIYPSNREAIAIWLTQAMSRAKLH